MQTIDVSLTCFLHSLLLNGSSLSDQTINASFINTSRTKKIQLSQLLIFPSGAKCLSWVRTPIDLVSEIVALSQWQHSLPHYLPVKAILWKCVYAHAVPVVHCLCLLGAVQKHKDTLASHGEGINMT